MKALGIAAVAALVALVVGFGGRFGSTPTAHADVTDVAVVGCEFIVGAIDGDTTDTPTAGDVAKACGLAPMTPADVTNLANAIGNEDGKLTKSDFADIEGWDDNQVANTCNRTNAVAAGLPTPGLYCDLAVFVFVNDEKPVTLDLPSGLDSVEGGGIGLDFTCNSEGAAFGQDNDCDDGANGGAPNNGDGVVVFNVFNGNASPGQVKTVGVSQESIAENFDVNVVGEANDVKLTLVESTISTSGASASNQPDDPCETNVNVTEGVAPANSTLAYAQAFDASDTILARVPVDFSISPPSADQTVVSFGIGNPDEAIVGGTQVTLKPNTPNTPIAVYQVLCGGTGTGTATIVATIENVDPITSADRLNIGPSQDTSSADITVVGAANAITATVSPAEISCNGTSSATVSVTVTDANGNNVADGTPVNFSVVALGTANPINTVTKDGKASTTVTPLSNASAGVTVIVTAGDSSIATPVQTSTRVDCALPISTQPSPAATPTRTGISGPDTGNGGYLGQDSASGFPMWTLVVLAAASLTLVGGGLALRRSK